jgi:acyl carrier protein
MFVTAKLTQRQPGTRRLGWSETSKPRPLDFALVRAAAALHAARARMDDATLNAELKQMLVENLMLQVTAAEIRDDQPLFGPGSLGLDSVDALQLVVALDKNYGLKIPDPAAAKEVLASIEAMAAAVKKLKA